MMTNPAQDQQLDQLVTQIEEEIVDHVLENMKHREITVEKAEELAYEFLKLLPATDKEDLLKKLNSLSGKYAEIRDVYVKYAKPHEEEKRQEMLMKMSEHIKAGNIEHAIAVAKGGTQ